MGQEFQLKLQQHGVLDASATSKNPTANAICERMHQTVGNILRTKFNATHAIPDFQTAAQAVEHALAACNHAMRCAVSQALNNHTPGEVVFGRDMLLNIPVIVDLLPTFCSAFQSKVKGVSLCFFGLVTFSHSVVWRINYNSTQRKSFCPPFQLSSPFHLKNHEKEFMVSPFHFISDSRFQISEFV